MKKRNNPKIEAMKQRSLIVENERQNLHTPKFYLTEQEEEIKRPAGDPYEYKKDESGYYFKKRDEENWKKTNNSAVKAVFGDGEEKPVTKSSGESKSSVKVPFKNTEEGNAFRKWVNDTHPNYAKEIKLDREGSHNNSYITKAWNKYGKDYKEQQDYLTNIKKGGFQYDMTMTRDSLEPYEREMKIKAELNNMPPITFVPGEIDDLIIKKIESKSKSDEGPFGFIRNRFPNIVQFFNAKQLTDKDFTRDAKKAIYDAIQSSIKRVGNVKTASTIYGDYGQDVASKFKNEKGSPSDWDVVWGAITDDDRFALATLLGRFTWKKINDKTFKVTDTYDFKHPGYKAISGVNRKSLEGKSILELKEEYGLSNYEAARVAAWVKHPDNIPSKSLPIELTINVDDFA